MDFEAFVRSFAENGWQVYGTEVWAQGRLLHRWGDTENERHPIYSCTKTITSLAAGMAVDDGRLRLENSVLQYLPGNVVASMSGEQREVYRHITLRRLLTMSVAGYPFRPQGDHWLKNVLNVPLTDVEIPRFDYSNISAYLVGVAAANALDEDLASVLNRRLFKPLGIHEPPFGRSPEGYFYGASNMELTVNELSRIGLLLANGGVYGDERIVSEAYVHAATSVQQMNREGGYGYFLWKYCDGFSINGKWGQKCYVLPERGLMVTFLANIPEGSGGIRRCMEQFILDAGSTGENEVHANGEQT